MPKERSEFQKRIIKYLECSINGHASAYEIAAGAFPEKWTKRVGRARSGRAALIGHVTRAALKMKLTCWRGEGMHAQMNIALPRDWRMK
jgi:hypothetical protein